MDKVFINYRREETAGEARALFSYLSDILGKDSVFMDVDSIALGRDFRNILQETLESCNLMLVLIGKEWLLAKNDAGRLRLENPNDFIRLEIGAALKRNIPVIPVLVQGAHMPSAEQLPEDIKDLAYRNGFELSHNRWESDVQEMVKRLGLHSTSPRKTVSVSTTAPLKDLWASKKSLAITGACVLFAAVAGGVFMVRENIEPSPTLISPVREPCAANDQIYSRLGPGQNCIKLRDPRVRVYGRNIPVDYCLSYEEGCGPPLFNWYCQRWGYSRAVGGKSFDSGETYVFGNGQYVPESRVPNRGESGICLRSIHGRCDGLSYIDCAK